MDEVRTGGHRRIDRVMAPGYLDDLADKELDAVRSLREEADQEEADLSYLRRLLQARLDLVQAELTRRTEGRAVPENLVAHLTAVLSEDAARLPAQGLGRHRTVEPSRPGETRRQVEQLVSDDLLTDLPHRSDDELRAAAQALQAEEQGVSARRAEVQRIADAVGQEIARRYRDGEADVATLLPGR